MQEIKLSRAVIVFYAAGDVLVPEIMTRAERTWRPNPVATYPLDPARRKMVARWRQFFVEMGQPWARACKVEVH